ncbi:MAG TPA: hypothetical protein PKU82_07025 [Bacteroidia bacterium]|nr:hypothetical protein [Bacteroidia bacterium]HOZ90848.1 hypothetical protein [Bacteroidia bacterium]HRB52050.1 hypothetical protein [Bacteroidia bacterium]
MESVNDFKLEDLLSYNWLLSKGYVISLPEKDNKFAIVFVARILYRQVPRGKNMTASKNLSKVMDVTTRTLYKYIDCGFAIDKIFKDATYLKYTKERNDIFTKPFICRIIDKSTKQEIVEFDVTIQTLYDSNLIVDISEADKADKPKLDMRKIIQLRNDILNEDIVELNDTNREDMERLAMHICEVFGTGCVTITEACDRYNVNYLTWIDWLRKNAYIRQMYEEACRAAALINHTRQLSLVDNRLNALLNNGFVEETTFTYDKVFLPGRLEPVYREKTKVVRRRDLDLSQLAMIKGMLYRSLISLPPSDPDDFSNWSTEEILNYVNSMDDTEKMDKLSVIQTEILKNPPE